MPSLVIQRKGQPQRLLNVGAPADFERLVAAMHRKERLSADGGVTWHRKSELGGLRLRALVETVFPSRADGGQPGSAPPVPGSTGATSSDGLGTPDLSPAASRSTPVPDETTAVAPATGAEELEERLRNLVAEVASLQTAHAGLAEAIQKAASEAAGALEARVREQLEALDQRLGHERSVLARVAGEWSAIEQLVEAIGPGTVAELRQRLEEQRQQLEDSRRIIQERGARIDELERQQRLDELSSAGAAGALQRLEQRDAALRAREKAVASREELQLRNDSLRERLGVLEGLKERYERYQTAFDTDEALRHENEQLRRHAERAEAEIARLRGELTNRAPLEERLRALQTRIGDVERQKALLEATLAARDAELAPLRADAEAARQKLAELVQLERKARQELAKEREQLHKDHLAAEQERRAHAAQHEGQVRWRVEREVQTAQEQLVKGLQAQVQDMSRERDELRRLLATAVAHRDDAVRERQSWLAAETTRRAERDALVEQSTRARTELDLVSRRTEELLDLLSALPQRYDETRQRLEERLDHLRKELSRLEAERDQRAADLKAIERNFKDHKAFLDTFIEDRKREANSVQLSQAERTSSIDRSAFDDPLPTDHTVGLSERSWLDDVARQIEAAGFVYQRRLLDAFHTSLKISAWSPLTALAGVSGTGKSELPRLYAELGGLHFLPVSVQPNWDSPQDLFGFFNYMDNRYKATPLLQALVQSQKDRGETGFADAMLLVLLDEMNLARIELYLSEILSKLGSTREEAEKGGTSEPTIEIDIGLGEVRRLRLGRNVLYVGTMNEDETTKSLSDKALDRGNVLTFPSPRELRSRPRLGLHRRSSALPARTWQSWVVEPEDTLDAETRQEIRTALDRINEALGFVHRAVGHRVLQAAEAYVANHPWTLSRIGDDSSGSLGTSRSSWRRAFEDQLAQRIMPKLRGIDPRSEAGRHSLDQIADILRQYAGGLSEDFALARDAPAGTFVWHSSRYLEH